MPAELRLEAASRLDAIDLLSLALVSREWRDAAEDPRVWCRLTARHLKPILDAFFNGAIPLPPSARSWKRHYFCFRVDWKRQAQRHTGRLLVQVGAQAESGRGPGETVSLCSLWDELFFGTPLPPTYGVYDVTRFADEHPGADLIILDACELGDATSTFEMAAHSDAALRRLETLVVPGLAALPYDHSLEERRTRGSGTWVAAQAKSWWVAAAAVLASCLSLRERGGEDAAVAVWCLTGAVCVAALVTALGRTAPPRKAGADAPKPRRGRSFVDSLLHVE